MQDGPRRRPRVTNDFGLSNPPTSLDISPPGISVGEGLVVYICVVHVRRHTGVPVWDPRPRSATDMFNA